MSNEQCFLDVQADFYHYMIRYGGIAKKTSHDYISRLRFLAKYYRLDESITTEKITNILEEEEIKRHNRDVYNTKHAIGDFKAGLRKFQSFIEFGYKEKCEQTVKDKLNEINEDESLNITERKAIILSRKRQGKFRESLIEYWRGCAVSACTMNSALIASHIKPWRDSNNEERLDVFNGLLLLPNYDKLFDLGYMTFTTNGDAVFSSFMSANNRNIFGVENIHLTHIDERHKKYLEYHNEFCFIE